MVLELRNVSMKFNSQDSEIEVLDNINFSLEEGEIIAIVGPSGSGKTTILNLIAGLLNRLPARLSRAAKSDICFSDFC